MMEFYSPVFTKPPVGLVALLGCSCHHKYIREFLCNKCKPPLNALSYDDPWLAARELNFAVEEATDAKFDGIIQAEWMANYHYKSPSVVALIVDSQSIRKELPHLTNFCSALETIQSATRHAKVIVICILDSVSDTPINDLDKNQNESFINLCKKGGIEQRYIFQWYVNRKNSNLDQIGRVMHSLSNQYYLNAGRHQIARLSTLDQSSSKFSASIFFMVAAFAEFRTDWPSALKGYQGSYMELTKLAIEAFELNNSQELYQKVYEILLVSEIINVKIITLMMHQEKILDAVQQFDMHMSLFLKPAIFITDGFDVFHQQWIARQYLVMGQLLEAKFNMSVSQNGIRPSHYYVCSAQALIKVREASQRQSMLTERDPTVTEKTRLQFKSGKYIGEILCSTGRNISDTEFMLYLTAKYLRPTVDHSMSALAALQLVINYLNDTSKEQFVKHRENYVKFLLAQEYASLNESERAISSLVILSGEFRLLGWTLILRQIDLLMLECSRKTQKDEEFMQSAFELISLCEADEDITKVLLNEVHEKINGLSTQVRLKINSSDHSLYKLFDVASIFDMSTIHFNKNESKNSSFKTGNSQLTLHNLNSGWEMFCVDLSCQPGKFVSVQNLELVVSENLSILWMVHDLPVRSYFTQAQSKYPSEIYEVNVPPPELTPRVELRAENLAMPQSPHHLKVYIESSIPISAPEVWIYGSYSPTDSYLSAICLSLVESDLSHYSLELSKNVGASNSSDILIGKLIYHSSITACANRSLPTAMPTLILEGMLEGTLNLYAELHYHYGESLHTSQQQSEKLQIECLPPFKLVSMACMPWSNMCVLPRINQEGNVFPTDATCMLKVSIELQVDIKVGIFEMLPKFIEDIQIISIYPDPTSLLCEMSFQDRLNLIVIFISPKKNQLESMFNMLIKYSVIRGECVSTLCFTLELPAIYFRDPVFSVSSLIPSFVKTEDEFNVVLSIKNHSGLSKQVLINIRNLFEILLLSKDMENASITIPAMASISVSLAFRMGEKSGIIKLPSVTLEFDENDSTIRPLQGRSILAPPM